MAACHWTAAWLWHCKAVVQPSGNNCVFTCTICSLPVCVSAAARCWCCRVPPSPCSPSSAGAQPSTAQHAQRQTSVAVHPVCICVTYWWQGCSMQQHLPGQLPSCRTVSVACASVGHSTSDQAPACWACPKADPLDVSCRQAVRESVMHSCQAIPSSLYLLNFQQALGHLAHTSDDYSHAQRHIPPGLPAGHPLVKSPGPWLHAWGPPDTTQQVSVSSTNLPPSLPPLVPKRDIPTPPTSSTASWSPLGEKARPLAACLGPGR